MSRFFSIPADEDLDGVIAYSRGLPVEPANRIGKALQSMLRIIANDPQQGLINEELSTLFGEEVRSRVVKNYVLYYAASSDPRLILAILHGKRDADFIMRKRLG